MINLRLLALIAVLAATAWMAGRTAAARRGLEPGTGVDLVWWATVGYVLAARGAWLAVHPGALAYPIDVIRITQGLVTAAGVAGAVAGVALFVARRAVAWRDAAAVSATVSLVAAVAWHTSCPLQSRCGGSADVFGTTVPVAPALAVAAVALAIAAWRSLTASRSTVPVTAVGAFLLLTALTAGLRLRLEPWPTPGDVLLAVEGLALVCAGVLDRRTR